MGGAGSWSHWSRRGSGSLLRHTPPNTSRGPSGIRLACWDSGSGRLTAARGPWGRDTPSARADSEVTRAGPWPSPQSQVLVLHCDPATRDLCCRWEAEALPTGPPPPQPPLTGPPGLAGLLTAAHTWPLRSHPGQHFTRPPGAWHPLPRGLTINAARAGVRASRPVGRRPVARVQGPLHGPGFPDSGTPGLCKAPAPRLGASARAWVPLGPAGLGGPSPA